MGGSSSYIHEILLSRVLEEEQEIQCVLATPHPADESPKSEGFSRSQGTLPSFNLLRLFASGTLTSPDVLSGVARLLPPERQATTPYRYTQNVGPLSKVLHLPTDQVTVFSAILNPDAAATDTRYLLFATYFTSISVLTPEDAKAIMGRDKAELARNYKMGFEISVTRPRILG